MKKLEIITCLTAALLCGCTGHNGEKTSIPDALGTRSSSKDAVATTQYGQVVGYVEKGVNIFKGIPFAKAERFMPPTAPDRWEGVRSSRYYGPTCPQAVRAGWQNDSEAFAFNWDDGQPGEDCLRVNIWTQGLNDGRKRPVMVWLHGGGFASGSGQELPAYDGLNLARKGDVVVVTLNHRLNVLGFLDLSAFGEKYRKSGNVGMLDIVAALEWVRDNIAAFGGDPGNVTIFGQSGGGAKVSTLMAMPSARGLFHKAIVESGSICSVMDSQYSRRIGTETVRILGLTAGSLDRLARIPYTDLLAAMSEAISTVKEKAAADGVHTSILFGQLPVADGVTIPSTDTSLKENGWSGDIPVIIGTNLHEFRLGSSMFAGSEITQNDVKSYLSLKYGVHGDDFLDAVLEAYPESTPADILDLDLIFRPLAAAQAENRASVGRAPVYEYLFTWRSPMLDGSLKSAHCLELPFVFDNIDRCSHMTGDSPDARRLAETMSRAWINFARTGNPNGDGLPGWEPFTVRSGGVMIFDTKCGMKYNHDKKILSYVKDNIL